MLVISRKKGESITIQTPEGPVTITVIGIRSNNAIRIGVEAPEEVSIHREEIYSEIQKHHDVKKDVEREE